MKQLSKLTVLLAVVAALFALLGSAPSAQAHPINSFGDITTQFGDARAVFYEHGNYQGFGQFKNGLPASGSACRNVTWWKNDKISSLITGSKITVYRDTNCTGVSATYNKGSRIANLGWLNDQISSIRIYK